MFIETLIATVLLAMPRAGQAPDLHLKITLFEVPFRIVSMTFAGWTAKDGSVVGKTVGGATTGAFPAGAIVLQNRLPAESGIREAQKAIREFMADDCVKAQNIIVNELAEHELCFGQIGESGQEVYQELSKGRPSPVSYRIHIELAWENEDQVGLALRIWLNWQDPGGIQDFGGIVPERLAFDETISAKTRQTSLVAFPTSESHWDRSIIWLAISVRNI
jgi:hypothetical protein